MKLSPFIAGVFGTVGFALSILAGIATGNSIEAILLRGLICAATCYIIGYGVGLIAQQVALEHASHVSKLVAAQDAEEESRRLQAQADLQAENAANNESSGASVPAAAASAR